MMTWELSIVDIKAPDFLNHAYADGENGRGPITVVLQSSPSSEDVYVERLRYDQSGTYYLLYGRGGLSRTVMDRDVFVGTVLEPEGTINVGLVDFLGPTVYGKLPENERNFNFGTLRNIGNFRAFVRFQEDFDTREVPVRGSVEKKAYNWKWGKGFFGEELVLGA